MEYQDHRNTFGHLQQHLNIIALLIITICVPVRISISTGLIKFPLSSAMIIFVNQENIPRETVVMMDQLSITQTIHYGMAKDVLPVAHAVDSILLVRIYLKLPEMTLR